MFWPREVSNMPKAFQSYKPRHMKVYGSILINNYGEVLLVKGRLSKKWSFPKGHCKRYETDLDCAKRELLEETGLVVDTVSTSYHKLKGGSYFVFAVSGRPSACFTDHKEIELVQWWPLNDLPSIDSNVDVSIFRSLMNNLNTDITLRVGSPGAALTVSDYIDTEEARQKISAITRNINNSIRS
jgi:ADP-ribose pyrophosphatase YjhB (NUDIX family)